MRHHKGPKQKTAQAQKTPTARGERQPPHSRQPCARATTQHPAHPAPRPYTTSPSQHSQTPPRLSHANGGFTTIDTPPRRVAGVSQPYGRNSPHTPTHNRHPRPAQTPIDYDLARTQQPHATPARPSVAPPPRFGRANGEFYYHRHPATACRTPMVAIPPTHPPTTANPAPEQQRSTPHTPRHAHTQPRHRSIRRPHLDTTRAYR